MLEFLSEGFRAILMRVSRAAVTVAAHAAVTAMVIGSVYAVNVLFRTLYPTEFLLFGVVPIEWIFDATNVVALISFGVSIILDAIRGLTNSKKSAR